VADAAHAPRAAAAAVFFVVRFVYARAVAARERRIAEVRAHPELAELILAARGRALAAVRAVVTRVHAGSVAANLADRAAFHHRRMGAGVVEVRWDSGVWKHDRAVGQDRAADRSLVRAGVRMRERAGVAGGAGIARIAAIFSARACVHAAV